MNELETEDIGTHLTFDRSVPGRCGVTVPDWDGFERPLPPSQYLREDLCLPEMSQGALVRYYTALSRRNFGVDSGPYPLGSCTMKYNPKVNDTVASLTGFATAHPMQQPDGVQGTLALLYGLQDALAEITGLPGVSLAPAAGAQGELAGMLMIKHLIAERGEQVKRTKVIVPASAHGTNPATARMAGFSVTEIPAASDGSLDPEALRAELDDRTAALMVTCPNTLGLWERGIEHHVRAVHDVGGFVYGDGANLNAIMGQVCFGDIGFDVVHVNLHKTFSTPHGGGGPGAGPVCATSALSPFLPDPVVTMASGDQQFALGRPPKSIGRLQQFNGNVAVLLRAYAYILSLGPDGIRQASASAVLNANYLKARLRGVFEVPYDRPVLHEVVFSAVRERGENDVRAQDIAKRLIDHGIHPPTVYFPLIVPEALMFEPTETESLEDLDTLVAALEHIATEVRSMPELVRSAPHTTPIGRLDEVEAARHPYLRWTPE